MVKDVKNVELLGIFLNFKILKLSKQPKITQMLRWPKTEEIFLIGKQFQQRKFG